MFEYETFSRASAENFLSFLCFFVFKLSKRSIDLHHISDWIAWISLNIEEIEIFERILIWNRQNDDFSKWVTFRLFFLFIYCGKIFRFVIGWCLNWVQFRMSFFKHIKVIELIKKQYFNNSSFPLLSKITSFKYYKNVFYYTLRARNGSSGIHFISWRSFRQKFKKVLA